MKREFGGNFLKLLFFIACVYGIIRISIWSYFQTQLFFVPFDGTTGNTVISHGLSLLSQYGQNVVLFLAMIEGGRRIAYQNKINKSAGNRAHVAILEEEINKSTITSNIYYSLFAIFALVDSGTNLGEFFKVTYVQAKLTLDPVSLLIFAIVGSIISVVVVFVEELFMAAVNATLHAFNDVLTSIGAKRFSSLDLFVDPDKVIATRLDERGQATNNNPQTTQNNGRNIPSSIPKKNDNSRDNRNNNQNSQNRFTNQNQQVSRVQQEPRTPRPTDMNDISREPSYHKIINMNNLTEQELQEILDEKNKKGNGNRYDA